MGNILDNFKKTKEYLVCVDSDGCLLDNMELKHKECFCPATVNVWDLQGASRFVRECAEYVNLYSKSRGRNRFPAIVLTLELAYARPELIERGYVLPDLTPLKNWIKNTPVLGAKALEDYAAGRDSIDPVLETAARWSREVDANIKHIVRNIKPFPYVKETLKKLSEFANIVVVSATPNEALTRELKECGIAELVDIISGQEAGTKSECIRRAKSAGFDDDHVLKIGDAPGDLEAANDNNVLFHPIVPGRETESWKRICDESSEIFRNHNFRGEYMEKLCKEFFEVLRDVPPWTN